MALLGYIDNTAVYDDRLVTEAVKARVPDRIEKEHLVGTRCLVIVKETTLWRQGFYFKLRDGLVHEGKITATFYEKGRGLFLRANSIWAEDDRRMVSLDEIRQHFCHATDCARMVAPKFLMCRYHWGMVPKAIQDAVWQAYQPGQELGEKQPTNAYVLAVEAAMKAVADLEAAEREARAKRDAEFEARKRESAEKKLRKQGGQAAKAMFGGQP
jgi:hypothetical protein